MKHFKLVNIIQSESLLFSIGVLSEYVLFDLCLLAYMSMYVLRSTRIILILECLILESESKDGIPNLTSGQVTKIIFSGKSSGETRA